MNLGRAEQHDNFRRLCAEKGLAITHQREVIYYALMSMEGHPAPELVYEKVREQIPSISLATIYKNIKTFVDEGLLREVSLHHGSTRLETNAVPHHHLVCSRCRSITDLPDEQLEPIHMRAGVPDGFHVERFSVEVIGICGKCADAAT